MNRNIAAALTTAVVCTAALLAGGTAASAAGPAPAAGAAACVGGIRVNSFAFHPASVHPGASSAATLALTNCTGSPVAVNETWYGRFTDASGGFPSGCPVVDPFLRSRTVPGYSQVVDSTSYLVFAGCTATAFTATVTLATPTGTVLTTVTAVLTIN